MYLNLRTGERRESRPEDYCTKATAVIAKEGEPTRFLAFLDRIMSGDQELIDYLQRVFGYCCTGHTTEHTMFFFYGTGANGKSVLLSTISGILGSYHKTAAIETFTVQSGTNHPTDLAHLMGARLVTSVETEEGRRWAEAKIKALTGGDEIAARFMRQDFFTFKPQFKLVVAGNHKPSLRTVDEAMKRRLHMVPFRLTIPKEERDPELVEKLKPEWPQILNWMIKGYYEWKRKALATPKGRNRRNQPILRSTGQNRRLEGPGAFFDFAVAELVDLFGSGIRTHLRPLFETGRARDPFARESYSYAPSGYADARAALAAPVDGRLFFAGAACSLHDFTTAHGAYLTGIEAAEEVIALKPRRIRRSTA